MLGLTDIMVGLTDIMVGLTDIMVGLIDIMVGLFDIMVGHFVHIHIPYVQLPPTNHPSHPPSPKLHLRDLRHVTGEPIPSSLKDRHRLCSKTVPL